ncbi:cytochrome c [Hahella aquimaris]|uniref:c-type cytochrome n=1 Tax=Hahella sp. HNIBRBA332 TaxID=3015983 RepID=UPI00273B7ADA|nr:cytochrome c [Hahella sp. HNIBRBA332]WLQ16322.1 cytochrome c [Hahella sp. HNIBRBA332]
MKGELIITLIIATLLQGCSDSMHWDATPQNRPYSSNGERIYFTGKGSDGSPIPIIGGHHHMGMHGGGCATCHGENREGGIRMWPWFWVIAPPLTVDSLKGETHEDGWMEDEHDHVAYDLDSLSHAITHGEAPDGSTLNDLMPRWRMSDQDLSDLTDYLLLDTASAPHE